MKFKKFLDLIPKINNLPLPGKEAQFEMAPMERIKELNQTDIDAMSPRQAAVMALFYERNDETYIILILRKTYKGVHSNQVGFPGGKVEEEDQDLLATAVRETFEEVGVPQEAMNFIKEMTNIYIPPSNFWVQSFMGFTESTPRFKAQDDEVEALIEVPLRELLHLDAISTQTITTSYMADLEVPVFVLQEHIVWGATAMMLNEIKELLLAAAK